MMQLQLVQQESTNRMKPNVFPTTLNSWIGHQLVGGHEGRAAINHHVMSVYAWPLEVYFKGTSDRWLGDAHDIVQGFFADRLDRPNFFDDWQRSGLRLRRWLMNGFCLYLKELKRRFRRDRQVDDIADADQSVADHAENELDRAFVIAIVRQALADAQAVCKQEGLSEHWHIFMEHHYHGRPYQDIATACSLTPARAAVMARTAGRKFRAAQRNLLLRDGASPEEFDSEIEALLEAVGQ